MNKVEVSLAIIGGGPAGLAGAARAASLGVGTLVLDLHAQAGGHYFSLPASEFRLDMPGEEHLEGRALVASALEAGAQIWNGAQVWGVYPEDPFRICLSGGAVGADGIHPVSLRARQVILAPGAVERIVPFPGWTLPGVMTAGGALALLKNQCMLPGRRILLAGSGPLLLSAAARLAEAGAQVVAVLETRGAQIFSQALRHWDVLFTQGGRLAEGLRYLRTLRAKRVPYRLGWVVTRAEGQDGVERAVIARVDGLGKLVPGSEQSVEVDCICLGYGLLPATQFTRILECEHSFDPLTGAYIPMRDEWMQTSMPGVYAVGDGAQIAGKPAALLEGELVGLRAAVQLGQISESRAVDLAAPLRKKLAVERRFAHVLNQLFGPPPDLYKLVTEDTVICRCENITYGQIREAIADGASSVQAVKYHSRAGMGWCQGSTCAPLIAQAISRERGIPLEAASRASARPPVFPVSIEELMNLED